MTDSPSVVRVSGPLVEVRCDVAVAVGDLIGLGPGAIPGEVVSISDGRLTVQAYEYTGGLKPGDDAEPQGFPLSAPLGPGLLGGVFDGLLRPLTSAGTWLRAGSYGYSSTDGWRFEPTAEPGKTVSAGAVLGVVHNAGSVEHRVLVPPGTEGVVESVAPAGSYSVDAPVATVDGTPISLGSTWPVRTARPYRSRREDVAPLNTGQRVLDLLFPIALGSTAGVPGGFGTGKTVLLQQLAKWCDADVIVYVGCGERGNEMAEIVADMLDLVDPRTGGRLADRSVIIANTSNMPMMAREASIYTGVTVAEYYRDMGYHVVVIADSTSRWAEALREFASRMGELPAEEGYPATLATELAAFYERAGYVDTLGGGAGSVTVIGAVSPSGGDMSEPVTVHTERFVRCRWTLDRDLAYSRHYPAVSWSASFSRDAEPLGSAHVAAGNIDWAAHRGRVLALLNESDRLAALTELVGVTALADSERIELLGGRLLREAVLQQNALVPNDAHCSPEKTAALVDAVLAVIDVCHNVVAAGVPAELVEETDFGPLIRARDDGGPSDTAVAAQRRDEIAARLQQLR
ncbi:V-type ATP synthase subunit A [Mycobacterium sp. Y57]|uniref:V-type ATP synthase subunit A n=1 Tax=Mycolicibacterium xanthum TaxID=2796469 RepID=UPI001C8519C3|nr:V-type ATP synthase subunit A [Mycolicibacterium xanthum]MBX7431084.1 V-type ATP synthase subunit A [Mycolicibacterium xanthum]